LQPSPKLPLLFRLILVFWQLNGVDSISLQYPDGPRDVETLMVDPITKDIDIISKRTSYSRVYRAAYPQSISSTTTLEYKCQLPWGWAVGGDIIDDGVVDFIDFAAFADVWPLGDIKVIDLDNNGVVDFGDLVVFVYNWLETEVWP
jgi:hypothetical protein